jgi:hypothetical protein
MIKGEKIWQHVTLVSDVVGIGITGIPIKKRRGEVFMHARLLIVKPTMSSSATNA